TKSIPQTWHSRSQGQWRSKMPLRGPDQWCWSRSWPPEVVVPEEHMGDVIGDLNSRRGRIEGMELRGTTEIIRSSVPLSEMLGYATYLRSQTQGRASYSMHFDRYEPLPGRSSSRR